MLDTENPASLGKLDYVTLQRELGYALRSALASVLWQPMPETIRLLLEQLSAKERQKEE